MTQRFDKINNQHGQGPDKMERLQLLISGLLVAFLVLGSSLLRTFSTMEQSFLGRRRAKEAGMGLVATWEAATSRDSCM